MESEYEQALNQIIAEHGSYLCAIDGMNASLDNLFSSTRNALESFKENESKQSLVDAYKRTYFAMKAFDGIDPYNFQLQGKDKQRFVNFSVLDKISLSEDLQGGNYEIDKKQLKDLIGEHLEKVGVPQQGTENTHSSRIDNMIDTFTQSGDVSEIVRYLRTRTNIYLKKSKTERVMLIFCFKFYGIVIRILAAKDDSEEFHSAGFIGELRELVNELPVILDARTKALKTNIIFFIKILQLPDVLECVSLLQQIDRSGILAQDVDQLTVFLEHLYYQITPNVARESSLEYFIEASLVALDQVHTQMETDRKKAKNTDKSGSETDLDFQLGLLSGNQFSIQLELPSYLSNFHESLTCPIDHRELNLMVNPAIILGCGHIFGQSTVKKLLDNFIPSHEIPYYGENMITCPYCNVRTSQENTRSVQYMNLREQLFENFVDYFE